MVNGICCLRLMTAYSCWVLLNLVDGTFVVATKPFKQLVSIHCFVKSDTCVKQIPSVFVLMSRRKRKDYIAVLSMLLSVMPNHVVKYVTSDFEHAFWRAIASILPSVQHRGCTFHWMQAVYRKVQVLGLGPLYCDDRSTHRLCRQLLTLPLLPAAVIAEQFQRLCHRTTSELLRSLFEYVDSTWVSSTVWPPSSWTAYRRPIRTNNDVEGWHYRLNRRARSTHLLLYVLLGLLWREAHVCAVQVKLVSDRKLTRSQKKSYQQLHSRLAELWKQDETGSKSAKQLLHACSFIYAPNE